MTMSADARRKVRFIYAHPFNPYTREGIRTYVWNLISVTARSQPKHPIARYLHKHTVCAFLDGVWRDDVLDSAVFLDTRFPIFV